MFELVSQFQPAGDQPSAIAQLTAGLEAGARHQVLLGVTGSGKTFAVANVIARLNRPTIVLSHNKTLAAQLYGEFKAFFPHNAVEYFVSYFDYFQPEAYIPRTDTFIEKDSSVNDEIERLRLSTMSSLFARRDVIVVASVSCIYGIGSREDYEAMVIPMKVGMELSREQFLSRLVDIQYSRNDIEFQRSHFRVRGDTVEVYPAYAEEAVRVEFFGEQIDRLTRFDPLTGGALEALAAVTIYPSKQFVTTSDKMKRAILNIREELGDRIAQLEKVGKLLEAQRLKMRTEYDLEMMEEMGFCSGIENYSRHIAGRPPGSRPHTLLDFLPEDALFVIDESHATVPQLGAMYAGDRSRKTVLVEHGFRLPSALDNRPLSFEEFQRMQGQTIYVSATPAERELEWARQGFRERRGGGRTAGEGVQSMDGETSGPKPELPLGESADSVSRLALGLQRNGAAGVVELIVRPTGLIDPPIDIRPLKGQIDDLIEEVRKRVEARERVLVLTLTKRTAEELTDYLRDVGISVRYLHSEIDAIERVEILRSLRKGDFDVLVGINLLREGLDLPEVGLVAILDADKEGYLRSATSLIQSAGRAARHLNGQVILYADVKTQSIQRFLAVSNYRRERQVAFNREHGITPRSVIRPVEDGLSSARAIARKDELILKETGIDFDVTETLRELESEMLSAANNLEFEKAALLRDQINELKRRFGGAGDAPAPSRTTYARPAKGRRSGKR